MVESIYNTGPYDNIPAGNIPVGLRAESGKGGPYQSSYMPLALWIVVVKNKTP